MGLKEVKVGLKKIVAWSGNPSKWEGGQAAHEGWLLPLTSIWHHASYSPFLPFLSDHIGLAGCGAGQEFLAFPHNGPERSLFSPGPYGTKR